MNTPSPDFIKTNDGEDVVEKHTGNIPTPMAAPSPSMDKITVRLAQTPHEVQAAQRLRYNVFYEEYKAIADEEARLSGMDVDEYDAITDHLIVTDENLPAGPSQIVGTYRLLRQEAAQKHGRFYTSGEFDITPLLQSGNALLELGRSCVLAPYRTRPVLQKLWQGIAHYVAEHKIGLMFGCASLHGTDPHTLSEQLSYLYHYHLAKDDLCPRALPDQYVEMNRHAKDDLDAPRIFMSLPPLMKGYMRLGASIGLGAVIDHQFNTIDVCIVMPTNKITEKYLKHYQRVTNNTLPIDGENQNQGRTRTPATSMTTGE